MFCLVGGYTVDSIHIVLLSMHVLSSWIRETVQQVYYYTKWQRYGLIITVTTVETDKSPAGDHNCHDNLYFLQSSFNCQLNPDNYYTHFEVQ